MEIRTPKAARLELKKALVAIGELRADLGVVNTQAAAPVKTAAVKAVARDYAAEYSKLADPRERERFRERYSAELGLGKAVRRG